jgi:hypothetical protein
MDDVHERWGERRKIAREGDAVRGTAFNIVIG